MDRAPAVVRRRFIIGGIVQGVGFRPHVHRLAVEYGLAGSVANTATGVVVEVEGPPDRVAAFAAAVVDRAPPLAVIDTIVDADVAATGAVGFDILASVAGTSATLIAPDTATCAECRAEVLDPGDRRFGYAFANCTNCGPRYSIVTGVPYDRANTTMATFTMCAACRTEYEDPGDRRFHAQPVCCPACGPALSMAVEAAAEALRADEIVAIKGVGGYHLAARASSDVAVARLRARKHREDKPFALMAADLASASALVAIEPAARRLLESAARPIVLLPRRPDAVVAAAVAPRTSELGVMLPYSPLHHLLLAATGEPIVLTSGNASDEPIAYVDDDARARLGPIADRFLTNDRPIHIRVEDSVARVVDGAPYLVRRSRGYAPAPVTVPWPSPVPVLACGAELKSTIALARERHVFVSQHIGDLKNADAFASFCHTVAHLAGLFEFVPEAVAHDLHPDYLSTGYALEYADAHDVPVLGVQHHHAHIASCLADNGVAGPVIGVAFDGAGFGTDGAVWGGEFLVADLATSQRLGWLAPVPLPGGDAAVREPWRMAAAYLDALGAAAEPAVAEARWHDVVEMARAGVNAPPTTSAGRLFDAVAALLGVRTTVTYEGQAAIELEAVVDPSETAGYPMRIEGSALVGADLVAAALADRRAGVAVGRIAARFHLGLAAGVAEMCRRLSQATGVTTVALSGGVFANVVLLQRVTRLLDADGFTVLRHRQVPCNDGGISLGQAVVAGACLTSEPVTKR